MELVTASVWALFGLAFGAIGVLVFLAAKSAVHEIEAGICLLLCAIMMSAALLLAGIAQLKETIEGTKRR